MGNYGCRAELCGNDDTTCTVTAGAFTTTFTGADEGDAITGLAATAGPWTENGSGTYTCQYIWSDGQTCNDSDNICTHDSSVSGGISCAGSAGSYSCGQDCGNDANNDAVIIASGKTKNIAVTDPDTITGITSTSSFIENGSGTYTCQYTWSNGLACNDSNDICDVSGSSISGGVDCAGSDGNWSCGEDCGNDANPAATTPTWARTTMRGRRASGRTTVSSSGT